MPTQKVFIWSTRHFKTWFLGSNANHLAKGAQATWCPVNAPSATQMAASTHSCLWIEGIQLVWVIVLMETLLITLTNASSVTHHASLAQDSQSVHLVIGRAPTHFFTKTTVLRNVQLDSTVTAMGYVLNANRHAWPALAPKTASATLARRQMAWIFFKATLALVLANQVRYH